MKNIDVYSGINPYRGGSVCESLEIWVRKCCENEVCDNKLVIGDT